MMLTPRVLLVLLGGDGEAVRIESGALPHTRQAFCHRARHSAVRTELKASRALSFSLLPNIWLLLSLPT